MTYLSPEEHDRITIRVFSALAIIMVVVGMTLGSCKDEPEDDEGSAVQCDYVCVDVEDGSGKSACDWYCEDPQIEVACQECEYEIRSGKATFNCAKCDVGTY